MQEKELLRKLGEETLYSAKGHFKACDLRRQLITYTIWLCVALHLFGITGLIPVNEKWLETISLLGVISLLIWNEGEGKDYRARHKEAGEKYLSVHKKIRACYFLSDCGIEQVELLNKEVIELDKSEKPEIPEMARRLAKSAIEKKDSETDNWFLKK